MDNTINICFSSDNNYAPKMAVAMLSILKNVDKTRKISFYIMDGGISEKNKNKILQLKKTKDFNIKYIPINSDDFKNCPISNLVEYITLPTYYRFKIPSLINADKVLYLDCDLIVLDDISKLFDTNIDNYYIAAAPEPGNIHHKARLNIQKSYYYCNAGVILINSKKWREENIEEKLFKYCENPARKIIHNDQDVLNEVLKYNIYYLNQKWNAQNYGFSFCDPFPIDYAQSKKALESPSIVHFTYRVKPWQLDCPDSFKKYYFKYLKISPYKNDFIKFRIKKVMKNFIKSLYCKQEDVYYKTTKILGLKFKKLNYKGMYNNISRILYEDKINNIKLMSYFNAVNNLHQKVFPKYKNINQGKDVILVATGPSLADFKPMENAVYIGVNKAFQYDKITFDYMFLQDYSGATRKYIDDFVNYNPDKTKKFLGYLDQDIQKHCIIPESYSNYKNVERYYTLHPDLKKSFTLDISSEPFGDAFSIAFVAMQFILWTNPKRIYLVGCDCSNNGHFDKNTNSLAVDYVMEGWKKMREFAFMYYPDTEIISINPVGLKGIFKDEYTK